MFLWKNSYKLGFPIIDAQHRQLVKYYNDLCALSDGNESDAVLKYFLDRLVAYAEKHFAEEERLLELTNYPDRDNHEESHKKFRNMMARLLWRYEKGERALAPKLVRYLKKWLTNHILVSDLEYSAHVKRALEEKNRKGEEDYVASAGHA